MLYCIISHMTCCQETTCPNCSSLNITKSGMSANGIQRYRCQHPDCPAKTFMLKHGYKAYGPGIKGQAVDMAINSSGIRDTARVLKINKNTVISTLKKASNIVQVNPLFLPGTSKPLEVRLELACGEAGLDEQWPFVGNKPNQRRLWHAVDHAANTVLAYVFGKRKDTVFQGLQALLAPFNIRRHYTDGWGAYGRHPDTGNHGAGKRSTQKIGCKNLTIEPGPNDWHAVPFAFQSWRKCTILLLGC